MSNIVDMTGKVINPGDTQSSGLGDYIGFANFLEEIDVKIPEEELTDILNEITYQPEATFVSENSEDMQIA